MELTVETQLTIHVVGDHYVKQRAALTLDHADAAAVLGITDPIENVASESLDMAREVYEAMCVVVSNSVWDEITAHLGSFDSYVQEPS